jgi:hypothetical protein
MRRGETIKDEEKRREGNYERKEGRVARDVYHSSIGAKVYREHSRCSVRCGSR